MTIETDTRDRTIKLEADVEHLTKKLEGVSTKVDEMHALLLQAKGAQWAILAMAAIGGFVSAKLSMFFPWLSIAPR